MPRNSAPPHVIRTRTRVRYSCVGWARANTRNEAAVALQIACQVLLLKCDERVEEGEYHHKNEDKRPVGQS